MSKLPTLYAVFRFWKDVPGSEVYISAHENESLAGHVQGLVRSNDATTRVVEYLPAAKCVSKDKLREAYEMILHDFEQRQTITDEVVSNYIGQLEALLET